jgi:SAM-dependent methyltransferase
MSREESVAAHYGLGDLEQRIAAGLEEAGKSLGRLGPDDLAPLEEFHIGGRPATAELTAQLRLEPGAVVLDVGCGIGGTARFLTRTYGCRVVGIDLTPEHIRLAESLSTRLGLGEQLEFHVGSASAMPFRPSQFDAAVMLHVGMNIEDKSAMFGEVHRVLRAGTQFAIYDVMRTGDGELAYPLPWAATASMSFLDDASGYRTMLRAAGFALEAERDRRIFGLDVFRQLQARVAETAAPALGVHLVMGSDAPIKIQNVIAGLEDGLIAPTEMVARAIG